MDTERVPSRMVRGVFTALALDDKNGRVARHCRRKPSLENQ
jgi:hypothetical protein